MAVALPAFAAGATGVPGRPMTPTLTCPTDSRSVVLAASRIVYEKTAVPKKFGFGVKVAPFAVRLVEPFGLAPTAMTVRP